MFKPGECPNPNGRPKGSGHRQKIFNELVAPHKDELVKTAINLALSGNEQMLKVFFEKILPAKPIDEPVIIGELAGSLTSQGEEILSLVMQGEITPSQGEALLSVLTAQANIVKIDDLIERIEKLEKNK